MTDEEKALTLEAAKIINEQFVTPEFVTLCAETLIGRYMLLTPDDFAKWEEDPEGWVNAADSENWEFEIRPCAEITFMSLLSKHRDQIAPIMLNLVDRVCGRGEKKISKKTGLTLKKMYMIDKVFSSKMQSTPLSDLASIRSMVDLILNLL